MSATPRRPLTWLAILCLALIFAGRLAGVASAESPVIDRWPLGPVTDQDYPADPKRDITWSAGYDGLADVISAFNAARAQENGQLSTFVKPMNPPSPATYAAMSGPERALWLINEERTARGLAPLHGLESNVQAVAQGYAQWLLDNNKWGHEADGRTPWERLDADPDIAACRDFLGVAENLFWKGTTDPRGIPLVIEQAIYWWMYIDSGSNWGHRHAILWTPYTENSGPTDREGFLGIGHARGGYDTVDAQGNPKHYPYTDMIVMNVFDPCAGWTYAAPPSPPPPPTPQPVPTTAPPPATHSVSGNVTTPAWVNIEEQPVEPGTWTGDWEISDSNGATNGEYSWIGSTCRVYAGTYSAWAVGGGADGNKLACGDNYPNNVRSWMIYGPFSLEGAISAELRAMVWVYTEPNDDILCLAASTDKKTFNGPCVSGFSDGWVEEMLDLNQVFRMGSLLGRPQVYVAVAFLSDAEDTRPHGGVFVDNIVLRKGVIPVQATGPAAATTSGQDLYGVTISDENGHTAMTDQDGNFRLEGLSPGRHTLTAYRAGYQLYPASIPVDVTTGDVTGVRFVGTNTPNHTLYVPLVVH